MTSRPHTDERWNRQLATAAGSLVPGALVVAFVNGLGPQQRPLPLPCIALELSDRDIELSGELIKIEGAMLQTEDHIFRYSAYQTWERGWWGNRIIPEIDSAFGRLESYSLVSRIAPPNNLNILADFQNRYVLLKKGALSATLIREAPANQARGDSLNSSQKP